MKSSSPLVVAEASVMTMRGVGAEGSGAGVSPSAISMTKSEGFR